MSTNLFIDMLKGAGSGPWAPPMTIKDVRNEDDRHFYIKAQYTLIELDNFRQQQLEILWSRLKIAYPIAFIGTIFIVYSYFKYISFIDLQRDAGRPLAYVIGSYITALFYWAYGPKRKYKKEYKQKIMPKSYPYLANLNIMTMYLK